MKTKRFRRLAAAFLTERSLPIHETLHALRQSEDFRVALEQSRVGASDRVLSLLLERAVRRVRHVQNGAVGYSGPDPTRKRRPSEGKWRHQRRRQR